MRSIAGRLSIQPDWLMAVMKLESNLNPRAVNKVSGATGLIQFMPSTARSLGTSTASLQRMTRTRQLDYVERYLRQFRGRMHGYVDVYLSVFFPAAMGKPDSYVIQTRSKSAALIAKQNPLYDTNRDSRITRGEIEKKYLQWHGLVPASGKTETDPLGTILLASGLVLGIWGVKKFLS